MHIPFVGIAITWAAVGSVIMSVIVKPFILLVVLSLFFWLMSKIIRFFRWSGSNKTAEREATYMALRGVRDSIGSGRS